MRTYAPCARTRLTAALLVSSFRATTVLWFGENVLTLFICSASRAGSKRITPAPFVAASGNSSEIGYTEFLFALAAYYYYYYYYYYYSVFSVTSTNR